METEVFICQLKNNNSIALNLNTFVIEWWFTGTLTEKWKTSEMLGKDAEAAISNSETLRENPKTIVHKCQPIQNDAG